MIVFGHNSFVVRDLSPEELNLQGEEWKGSRIQLRQKYAHVYYIPVFPIGQVWVVNQNKNNYHLNDNLANHLNNKYPKKIHFRAFALLIIVAIIAIILFISSLASDYKYRKYQTEEIQYKAIELNSKLDDITVEDTYLVFSLINQYSDDFSCKILQKKGNELLLGVQSRESDYDDAYLYIIPKKVSQYRYFMDNIYTDSVWVNIDEIRKAIPQKVSFKGFLISSIATKPIELKHIYELDDAYFIEDTDEDAASAFYKEYVNYGKGVVIDSVISNTGDEVWQISTERNVPFDHKFALKCQNFRNATIYYHTLDGTVQTAIISEEGSIINNYDVDDNDYFYY